MSNKTRWHILFSGKVQHVGFRYTAYYLAKGLYLTGWAENLDDGRVALEIQGQASFLRKFVLRLKSQPHIHITKMEINEVPVIEWERKFEVRG